MLVSKTSPILEIGAVLPFPGMVGAGRTIRALGFGANMHVSGLLNSPKEELLTWERMPYTERLGKDCNK